MSMNKTHERVRWCMHDRNCHAKCGKFHKGLLAMLTINTSKTLQKPIKISVYTTVRTLQTKHTIVNYDNNVSVLLLLLLLHLLTSMCRYWLHIFKSACPPKTPHVVLYNTLHYYCSKCCELCTPHVIMQTWRKQTRNQSLMLMKS